MGINLSDFADSWNFYKEDVVKEVYDKLWIQKSLESFEEQWEKSKDGFVEKIRQEHPNVSDEDIKNSIIKSITKGKILIDSKNNTVYMDR